MQQLSHDTMGEAYKGRQDGGARISTPKAGNAGALPSLPRGGTIQVIIPGQPQAKGRAKIVKIGGFSRMATPAKTVAYEGLVALCAQEALRGAALLEGPLRVRMSLWCQIPVSMTKKDRAKVAEGTRRPTTKPDIDNVVKAIFDGFNGVLWRDDVQVVELTVSKFYAETPSVVVNVDALHVVTAQYSIKD